MVVAQRIKIFQSECLKIKPASGQVCHSVRITQQLHKALFTHCVCLDKKRNAVTGRSQMHDVPVASDFSK